MASVNFGKCKSRAQAKAWLMHCDKDERLKHEHSNIEIDKTKSSGNMQMRRSYEETCQMIDDRIDKLDSTTNANRRKDRVEVMFLETALPKGLHGNDAVKWVRRMREIVADMYGEENIMNVYYHVDEVHEYTGEDGKKIMSREHVHIPVIAADREGKLNGKWFSSRSNMMKLNGALQRMSHDEFGLDYMDGSKKKSKKTVEELKQESRYREAVQKGVEDALPSIRAEERVRAENALKSEYEALQRAKEAYEEKIQQVDDLLSGAPMYPEVRSNALVFETEMVNGKVVPKMKRKNGILVKDENGKPIMEPAKPLADVVASKNAFHDELERKKKVFLLSSQLGEEQINRNDTEFD